MIKLISLLLVLLLVVVFLLPYTFIYPSPRPIAELNKRYWKTRGVPNFNGNPVSITNQGLNLSGTLYKTDSDSAEVALLLIHGISSNKSRWQDVQTKFGDKGISSLAVDLRGHGDSDAAETTYGYFEKEDISAWVRYLKEKMGPETKIGVIGHSLGGAITIQSLGSDENIDFGVSISSFSNVRKIINDYLHFYTRIRSDKMTDYILSIGESISKADFSKVNPVDYCEFIDRPLFIIHGALDEKIDKKYAKENFNAISHNQKELLFLDNANHHHIIEQGGDELIDSIVRFTEKYVTP